MPQELPKVLPPRRAVDHKIELEPGASASKRRSKLRFGLKEPIT